MNKEEAIEIVLDDELDNIIDYLSNSKNNNENVYVDYKCDNGIFRLYSSDIDFDNTYLRIYGLTRDEKKSYEEELNTSLDKEAVHSKYKNISEVYFDGNVMIPVRQNNLSLILKYQPFFVKKTVYNDIVENIGQSAIREMDSLNQLYLIPGVRIINSQIYYYVGDINEDK